MKEIWKKIKGYPMYSISNYGRVKTHQAGWRDPNVEDNGKILKVGVSGYRIKYPCVGLTHNKKRKSHWIHKLVWDHFGDGRDPKKLNLIIDHIDENRNNAKIDNLQLLTHRQNISKSKIRTHIPIGVEVRGNGRYAARIVINGQTKHLGSFGSIKEASQAYQNKLKEVENETISNR